MHKKAIIIACILFLLGFIIITIALNNAFHANDTWFHEDIHETITLHLQQNGESIEKIQFNEYRYTDYDSHIDLENEKNGTHEYPFTRVDVFCQTKVFKYTVSLFVDEKGELYVERYEKRKIWHITDDTAVILSDLEISENTLNVAKKINKKEIIKGFVEKIGM